MYLHAGLMHLVGNMLFLWLFGDNVEDVLGPIGFLLLYHVGGIAGSLLYATSNPSELIPSLGASGGVATVAGAYAVMFATRPVSVRVMLIVFPIYRVTLHAFWMLLLWFAADLAQTLLTRGVMKGAGINYVAHAGGFAFGFLVGLVARAHGVMRRYESVPSGEIWFGYWPARLEREHKLKQIQASKRERLLAARGAREVDYR
jgi:membrane associated rhomboid family serine protease